VYKATNESTTFHAVKKKEQAHASSSLRCSERFAVRSVPVVISFSAFNASAKARGLIGLVISPEVFAMQLIITAKRTISTTD